MTHSNCPNCNAAIKDGMFSSNKMMGDLQQKAYNYVLKETTEYCEKCFADKSYEAKNKYGIQVREAEKAVSEVLPKMPIITIHSPADWNYDVLAMVTAQSVTGEGAMTEFLSSWNDFFGTESNRMNNKIGAGEQSCKNKLRMQAFEIGGNAVIGTDIDYAEIGSNKGMLMVCMAGTAIKLKNLEVLGEQRAELIRSLDSKLKILAELQSYKNVFYVN